jgi:hypothetical protein
MAVNKGSVFVWREIQHSESLHMEFNNDLESIWWRQVTRELSRDFKVCPACGESLCYLGRSGAGGYDEIQQMHYISINRHKCPLCGWGYQRESVNDWTDSEHYTLSILKEFSVNDSALPMEELGAHLRKNVADIYALEPRKFEEFVADVFRERGFRTVLTQATRDGGADIIVFTHDGSKKVAIIECKKYSAEHKVGIGVVQRLVGAAISWKAKRGYLVTTSDFSEPARREALNFRKLGHKVDLVALSDLVKLLRVYNTKLPELHLLTEEMRREIVEANRKKYSAD